MLRDGATVRMSREDKYHFNIKCFLYIFWHFKSIVIMIGLCMDDLCPFFEHLTFHKSEFNGLHNDIMLLLETLSESFLIISMNMS